MKEQKDVIQMYSCFPFGDSSESNNKFLKSIRAVYLQLKLMGSHAFFLRNPSFDYRFYDINYYVRKYRNKKPVNTILDAGCGTGTYSGIFAKNNPQSSVVGIDITPKHIEIAKKKHVYKNLQFYVANNLDIAEHAEDIDTPSEGFDIIFSMGVLHHLEDPVKGLKNLESLLSHDGLLIIYLYDKYAMQPYDNFSQAISKFGDSLSYEERLELSKKLLKGPLKDQIRFQQLYREKILNFPDWILSDALFHPIRHSYDISEIINFLDSANLELIDFVQINPDSFFINPQKYFGKIQKSIENDGLYNKIYSSMSDREKLDLIQILFDSISHNGITFIAAKENQYKSVWNEKLEHII